MPGSGGFVLSGGFPELPGFAPSFFPTEELPLPEGFPEPPELPPEDPLLFPPELPPEDPLLFPQEEAVPVPVLSSCRVLSEGSSAVRMRVRSTE